MIEGFAPDLFKRLSGPATLANVPAGAEPFLLAEMARAGRPVAYVVSDGQHMLDLEQVLGFVAPEIPVLSLPGWDCLPYDRVSPSPEAAARRLSALSGADRASEGAASCYRARVGQCLPAEDAAARRSRVHDVLGQGRQPRRNGGYRRRGSPGTASSGFRRSARSANMRCVAAFSMSSFRAATNRFGSTSSATRWRRCAPSIPVSQRTTHQGRTLELNAMSEVTLTDETISRFRRNYLSLFGAATRDDALYQAVSEGRRYAGMEHWLPLFYEGLETAFDYLEGFSFVTDHLTREAAQERIKLVRDHYEARREAMEDGKGASGQGTPYKPVPPEQLYLDADAFAAELDRRDALRLSPFAEHESGAGQGRHAGGQGGTALGEGPGRGRRRRARQRLRQGRLPYRRKARQTSRVLVTAWSEGALDRMLQVLSEHGLERVKIIDRLSDLDKLDAGMVGAAVLSLENGFETSNLAVIGEQDILGDRMVRRGRRKKRGADFISEVAGLEEGSIVVHAEHGIGRFLGLRTIEAAGAPHACLELLYAEDAKLFLPVENIELLSRYGSEAAEAQLDKLGGVAWQARKARLKKRLLDMAGELIRIAAERTTRHAPVLQSPDGLYDEFAARFPYDETDDQMNAIEAVREDLVAGQADGPAGLRRRRLRQDRGGAEGGVPGRHERRAGRRRRADDAARTPALQDLRRTGSAGCRCASARPRGWSDRRNWRRPRRRSPRAGSTS